MKTRLIVLLALLTMHIPQRRAMGTERVPASIPRTVGKVFTDCEHCPRMAVIPPGRFKMGSLRAEQDWSVEHGRKRSSTARESPAHEVRIAKAFAVGQYEVTRGEFATFVTTTGYAPAGSLCKTYELVGGRAVRAERDDRGWFNVGHAQTDNHPVACVNWDDAAAYAAWMSKRTGYRYRLLSEAEWEYVARARSKPAMYRPWGESTSETGACAHANVADTTAMPDGQHWPQSFQCSDGFWATSPVGSFRPNAFGIYDIIGNVWEWVEDCGHESYEGAPINGIAWVEAGCVSRVLRGGAFNEGPGFIRSAVRGIAPSAERDDNSGFRIARDL